MLVGRTVERGVIDRALRDARAGNSRALVVRGEAGIGKTSLLSFAEAAAEGFRVVSATGIESEMDLAFASLHQVCAPLLDRIDQIPAPQAAALDVAFGRAEGPPPSPFLVGLAVLSLFAAVADERPLLCLVDDAQWLDTASGQVLAFVARRLLAESVVIVLAVREPTVEPLFVGIDELVVHALRHDEAHELLSMAASSSLDPIVSDRIVSECQGNPLVLIELSTGLTPGELAGGFGVPAASTLALQVQARFRDRFLSLPDEERQLLVVAAAEPLGDATSLWQAADRLGIAHDRVVQGVPADLLDIGMRVTFRHPLARAAVYWSASSRERRSAHEALADITDPERDPDRRAWHRAHAASGPDAQVADELEVAAGRSRARGGVASAASLLERATVLTPDPTTRGERALAAARAKHEAGDPESALELLSVALALPLDEFQAARAELLRGDVEFTLRRGADVPQQLLTAAGRLAPHDARLARETYLQALSAAWFAGRLAPGDGVVAVAAAAAEAPPSPDPPRVADLLLEGNVRLIIDGPRAGVPILRRAIDAFGDDDVTVEEEFRWLWMASVATADLWDDESRCGLAERFVLVARTAGALAVLPLALGQRFIVHLHAGELSQAASLAAEERSLVRGMGARLTPYGDLALAAFRGERQAADELIDQSSSDARRSGEGIGLTVAAWTGAVLHNGLGEYEQALRYAELATAHPTDASGCADWALAELVEAASRASKPDRVADALRRLEVTASAAGTDWALGVLARTRALVADDHVAEDLFVESVQRLDRTTVRVELARARLLYGEWLRRQRRRTDARRELRRAHEMFVSMEMRGFAERASRELGATGERLQAHREGPVVELTPQEAQIASLARAHLTNAEIGAMLFISPSTVDYHLRKVFRKLGITSRHRLADVLPETTSEAGAG